MLLLFKKTGSSFATWSQFAHLFRMGWCPQTKIRRCFRRRHRFFFACIHMSNEKKSWLFRGFRGFDILPSYVGIIMNHYKDPHLTTKIQRKVVSLQGELPERWRIRRTSGWLGQEESAVTWNSEKSLKISCINFFWVNIMNTLYEKYKCTIYVMMLLCNSILFCPSS